MGRLSNSQKRREQIVLAFVRVMADHGYAGATIINIANEANLTPGLIHHHFKNKSEILDEMLNYLILDFSKRLEEEASIDSYLKKALAKDQFSNPMLAKCWVGVMSESLRDPYLFEKIKKLIDTELIKIKKISNNKFNSHDAASILAYIFGSLVFGAFANEKVSGFAYSKGRKFIKALGT